MDQVVNHAAKWRYMSGGQVSVPFVIRGPISNGIGMAAQHSQSLEAWFVHTPGLIVVMPATPHDAKGLLKSGDPRGQPRRLPREAPALRQEGRRCRRRSTWCRSASPTSSAPGTDVTVVAAGATVPLALQAARQLAREGVELEVIDVAHAQAARRGHDRGVDREDRPPRRRQRGRRSPAASRARSSRAWSRRSASTRSARRRARVTAKDTPIPYATALEREVLPTVDDLVAAVNAMTAA